MKPKQSRRPPLTLLLAAALVGCGASSDASGAPDAPDQSVRVQALAVASTQLAVIVDGEDALLRFDFSASAGAGARADVVEASRVELAERPLELSVRQGAVPEWLVLSAGLRGVDAPMRLSAVDLRGGRRDYLLSAPYTSIAQTSDGRFALLRVERGADTTVFASAQLAVIDLDTDAPPGEVGLELQGAPPERVELLAPFTIGARTRHLAVASGPGQVALLDLEAPTQAPVRITLSADRTRDLLASAFDAERARLAVLAVGLDDVVLIELRAERQAERGYRVEVSNHTAGRAPSDLRFARDGHLLVLSDDGSTLRAFDAKTGAVAELPLQARAHRLSTCSSCAYALLHAPQSREATLVDVAAAVAGAAHAARPLQLVAPASELLQAGDTGQVGCVHDAGALTWFDLHTGRVTPLGVASDAARSVVADADGRLWFAPRGAPLVTHHDPARAALTEVLLRAPAAGFALLPAAGLAVVLHDGRALTFTVVPDAEPSFDASRYVRSVIE
jgi:hypothetical protein